VTPGPALLSTTIGTRVRRLPLRPSGGGAAYEGCRPTTNPASSCRGVREKGKLKRRGAGEGGTTITYHDLLLLPPHATTTSPSAPHRRELARAASGKTVDDWGARGKRKKQKKEKKGAHFLLRAGGGPRKGRHVDGVSAARHRSTREGRVREARPNTGGRDTLAVGCRSDTR